MSLIRTAISAIDFRQTQKWADDSIDHGVSADNNFKAAGENLKDAFTFDTHRDWTQGTGFFGRLANIPKGAAALVVDAFEVVALPVSAVKNTVDGVVHKGFDIGGDIKQKL